MILLCYIKGISQIRLHHGKNHDKDNIVCVKNDAGAGQHENPSLVSESFSSHSK